MRHIDINRSYEEGRHCSIKDRRKHRSDIVRLAGLLPPSARLELIEQMRADAGDFFADFSSYVNRQTDRKESASSGHIIVSRKGLPIGTLIRYVW